MSDDKPTGAAMDALKAAQAENARLRKSLALYPCQHSPNPLDPNYGANAIKGCAECPPCQARAALNPSPEPSDG